MDFNYLGQTSPSVEGFKLLDLVWLTRLDDKSILKIQLQISQLKSEVITAVD